jgi:hypothetical protein
VKRAVLLTLLLLAAAMLNVVVAWGCARWDETHRVDSWEHTVATAVPRDAQEYLGDPRFDLGFGPDRESGFSKTVQSSMACTVVTYSRWHDSDSPLGYSHSQSLHQYGFPFRSMQRAEREWHNPAAFPEFAFWRVPDSRGGWPIAPPADQQDLFGVTYTPPAHVYPITPIWTGFGLNTLVYAVAILCLFKARTARAWLRRRRNLCPKCAYPRGVSAVCTECGQKL